jgi:hypothetical protein
MQQQFSIALTSIALLIPTAAQAQQWQAPWQRQPPQYPGEYWQSVPPRSQITRDQLFMLNQQGQGQDQWGTYNTPIPAQDFFGTPVPDGAYRMPMQWDPNRSILLQIQDGQIRRQDYVLPR